MNSCFKLFFLLRSNIVISRQRCADVGKIISTPYELEELQDRRIHLLGGSPHEQIDVYKRLDGWAQVMSADGNMTMRIARDFSKHWQHGAWVDHPKKGTPGLSLYLDCWQRSCANIRHEWRRLTKLSSVSLFQMTLEGLEQTSCDREVGDVLEVPM